MQIRKAEKKDLAQIARIHKNEFRDHYLGMFSESLIAKFYAIYLEQETVFLVAEEKNEIRGFVMGGLSHILASCAKQFETDNLLRSLCESVVRPCTWSLSLSRVCKKVLHLFSRPIITATPSSEKTTACFLLPYIVNGK